MSSTYTTLPVSSSTTTTSTTSKSVLGKDDFLKLLITEMKNQDPLNPMQGTEYATQLAQFSSLEQLSNISDTLTESVSTNQLMTQSISNSLATTMIGKSVRSSTNSINFTGSGEATLGYTLSGAAKTVDVKIYNSAGSLVRTITVNDADSGDGTVTWDGLTDKGAQLSSGTYTFQVSAVDANGNDVTSSTYMTGKITGVRFTTSGTVFLVDGVEVPLSKITEILDGTGNG
jgi:flagellar basal-body rod modification protein FlgD